MYSLVVDNTVSGELTSTQARDLLASILREARKQKAKVIRKKDHDKFLIWNTETCSYNYFSYTKTE